LKISSEQLARFQEDGFVSVDGLLDERGLETARNAFDALFRGEFERGILPDEVNWTGGKSDPTLTRQICNGWKANAAIASIVLREDIGQAIAALADWQGTRILQDNLIWKPTGARPLGYHQDSAYHPWLAPQAMVSCWIALDDTTAEGGTMEVVRGSHKWKLGAPDGEFHGPANYQAPMRRAAANENQKPEIVPIVVRAGGGSFHHGRTWHGSGNNTSDRPRRSLVVHAIPANAKFVREKIAVGNGPVYGRYMKFWDDSLDENYFPILWTIEGGRTPRLDEAISA
jgi:ectoine hydroxylase-related dioxygenase (phytanoyl-CoA dioxygenase family)